MNQKLAHLTEKQIAELIGRYYEQREKVSDLINEYGIDVRPSAFVSLLPPIVYHDLSCDFCENQNLVSKRTSRDGWSSITPECPQCGHKCDNCRCKNCRQRAVELQQIEDEQKRAILHAEYGGASKPPVIATDITLTDAIYLLSVSRHSLSEDMDQIHPFSDKPPTLAPTLEYKNDLIKHLYAKGFIKISSESNPKAFVFDDGITETTAYYPTTVAWLFMPTMTTGEKRQYLREVENTAKEGPWPDSWNKKVDILWHLIAKYECFEYYDYLLNQRGFEFDKIGPKTHEVFENLLTKFSVSQIFNLTWQAVRDITDYSVKEDLPKYRTKNMFIGAIQRKADKYQAEGWELRHSRRDFNRPQTVLSSTFFDVFLEFGQAAFETKPSKIDLE
ncbi:MAG: hypothetical protein COA84_15875 [Robiginitomaculum sp.]|nr:MAG: hypothetical protein COA84_15875 [Robiginitomaculum sp.]